MNYTTITSDTTIYANFRNKLVSSNNIRVITITLKIYNLLYI